MNITEIKNNIKSHRLLEEFFTEKSLKQFKKYLIVGFTTFGMEYCLFLLFNQLIFVKFTPLGYYLANNISIKLVNSDISQFTYRYLISSTVVYVVVFWFNFFANRVWSFKSTENLLRQIKLYSVLFIFNLIATNVLLYFFSGILGILPQISKILVMGAVVSWNFILYKKVIYK